jgi:protein SCO1/2/putative membrane protein
VKYLWVVFVVIVACAVAAVVQFWIRKAGRFEKVPDFKLIERSGKPLTRADLLGRVWVAEFIFTRCAGSCPVMVSRMMSMYKKAPGATYVSFTVDPANDTPEVLAAYAKNNSLPAEWLFATGTYDQMQDLAKNGFKLSMAPGSSASEPIIHSDRLLLIDRYGRQRGSFSTSDFDGMARLEEEIHLVLAEPAIPVTKLPALNACLNGTSGFLLIVGVLFIKSKKVGAHKASMLAALVASTLFLVSYLTAHHFLGSTPFRGQGWIRPVYFTILITHTVLAALIVPLAMVTVYRAFREQFERHRALAKWTFPIWLYVSVTGVVIYFMLY